MNASLTDINTLDGIGTIKNNAARAFALSIFDQVVGMKPLDESADHAAVREEFATLAAASIFPALALLNLPGLPLIARDEITYESLFGSTYGPSSIESHEVGDAIDAITEAEAISPLSYDEQQVADDVRSLREFMENNCLDAVKNQSAMEDALNDTVGGMHVPRWLEDRIRWDDLYEEFISEQDSHEFNGDTFYDADNIE